MKKHLIIFMSLCFSSFVFAAECPSPIQSKWPENKTLDCSSQGKALLDGEEVEIFHVKGVDPKKKNPETILVKGEAKEIKLQTAAAAGIAVKAFAKAYPMSVDNKGLQKLLQSEYKTQGDDICLSFKGPADVLSGEVLVCGKTPNKTQIVTAPALSPKAVSLSKAKQLVLKEFQRLEKEEEPPQASEIFGDPDTVSRMILGPDLSSTMYYFWMALFSKNGTALIAVSLDGKVLSTTQDGMGEFNAADSEARIRKLK